MKKDRKPQINFQVEPPLKLLYDEAKVYGHGVARFCAAGLLLMIENPDVRNDAFTRLRAWEAQHAESTEEDIHQFVQGVHAAMTSATRGTRRVPPTRRGKRSSAR
jgi:hypothetical protein